MVYTLPAASTVDAYDVLLQGVMGRPTCCAHSKVGDVCAFRQSGDVKAIANSALVIVFFILLILNVRSKDVVLCICIAGLFYETDIWLYESLEIQHKRC